MDPDANYHYLTLNTGPRMGSNYMLEPSRVNRLGRGIDCDVVLADPLSSRVHAELLYEDGGWLVRDLDSRNGSFVGDVRVAEHRLESGDVIRIGTTELTFLSSSEPPTVGTSTRGANVTEDIVRKAAIDAGQSRDSIVALQRAGSRNIELLYGLCLKLLGCDEPQEVMRITLEQLHDNTQAAVVGFLWVADGGILKPQMLVPTDSEGGVSLSRSLTTMVVEQRQAIWVNHGSSGAASSADSLRPYADAVCVPVIYDGQTLGAVHLYLGQGRFRDSDFEFAISVSQVMAAALARSRRQASLAAEHRRLVDSSGACADLMGESASMKRLKEKIKKIAHANGCVLITGESGSGKELVAEALHKASQRSDRPLLAVNCAAIPPQLVESQLFGHVKGAFTGASSDHAGWFRQADTGTLFLDEIGELPLEAQSKLLRILESHPFLPVGGTKEVMVDVRIIAATNRDLREAVRAQSFREDLYYRLSVFEIKSPPLRDRDGDVELLLNHFLHHFKVRHAKPDMELSDKSRQKLLDYPWPGNIRQLRNVIDSAVVMATGNVIEPEDLGLFDAGTEHLETLLISAWEKKLIRTALKQSVDNVPAAAKLLGIGRATLYRKIEEYQIDRK